MGSNMQKQAVPLLVTEAPIVATGMEYKAAVDSGVVVLAKNAGVRSRPYDADQIVIRREDGTKDDLPSHKIQAFQPGHLRKSAPDRRRRRERRGKARSLPTVPPPTTARLPSVRNALIGFMTWEGYNYEDAVSSQRASCA